MPRLFSDVARSGRKARVGRGQLAADLDGFLGGGQGVLAAPHLAVADAEVVQRRGEVGEEGGVGRGPARGRAGRLPRRGPGRPGGAPPRRSGCRGCSAPRRGRGGRRGWRGQLAVDRTASSARAHCFCQVAPVRETDRRPPQQPCRHRAPTAAHLAARSRSRSSPAGPAAAA